jgi:hypothetical protein
LQTITDSVRNGDEAQFIQLMERGRQYLAARA